MKAALSVAACLAVGTLANDPIAPEKVIADIKTEELQRNLWNLNKIARDNGGNRAFGLPGYKASVDFVLERAQKRFAKEMTTWVQPFNATFETTREIKVTGPAGENVPAISPFYNTATPVPAGFTAPLIDTPVDDTVGSGCVAAQWEGIDATGKIAIVKRGVCAVSDKLKLAKAHGALAVVLWNQTPGPVSGLTLGQANVGKLVPVAIIPNDVGVAWKARLGAGETVVVSILVDSVYGVRESWNVFSETKEGDPNSVVMLGAHLDSVQAGPGINDDGSGSTTLLEIMGSFKKYTGLKNKVRFAWWGAEESGLLGSLHYTAGLSEAEADKIKYYFNYDMIGSPFPFYHVYKADNSAVGASRLADYVKAQGKPAEYGSFGSSSDYVGFLNLGIPSSGLFTGAGAPTDPCYHAACDNIDNVSWEALTINAKAAAAVAAELALSLDGVPARSRTTPAVRTRTQMVQQFKRWQALAREAAHEKTCSHHQARSTV